MSYNFFVINWRITSLVNFNFLTKPSLFFFFGQKWIVDTLIYTYCEMCNSVKILINECAIFTSLFKFFMKEKRIRLNNNNNWFEKKKEIKWFIHFSTKINFASNFWLKFFFKKKQKFHFPTIYKHSIIILDKFSLCTKVKK